MTQNQRAKRHYDVAVTHHELACAAIGHGQINDAIAHCSIVDSAIRLARFAAENHALVAGIPQDDPDTPVHQVSRMTQPPRPPLW